MNEEYVTITKAAELLGVSRQVIYKLAREGRLTIKAAHYLHGKHGPKRILRSEVEALISES